MTALRVSDIARHLEGIPGAGVIEHRGSNPEISGITIDSRDAAPGLMWAAVQGENAHGATFAAAALDRSVSAILTDAAGVTILNETCGKDRLPALVVCEDPRRLAAYVADLVYGMPSAQLSVVGVTGTNGKTSVTTMVAGALRELHCGVGVVGTNGTWMWAADGSEENIPTVRTTPEATDLHRLLASMLRKGTRVAALEISSHALVLHRADAVRVDVAVFTNLSHDHLDFHGTMEEYYRAKATLFTPEHAQRGVVCVDDDWGARLAAEARIPVTTYATSARREADFIVTGCESLGYSTAFTVRGPDGASTEYVSALPGIHYVANTLAVALVLRELGYGAGESRRALAAGSGVAGRMERVRLEGVNDAALPRVVVDYSHTPDALEKALMTMRGVPGVARITTVVGAGGQRDAGKRPLMGKVAARLSDRVIVTDDNPRGEDRAQIRAHILEGARREGTEAVLIDDGDRAHAIATAVSQASAHDLVLIAGKGAETGQDFGDRVIDFDDRVHARRALRAWVHAHKGETQHA